jgi:hypothetical protein
MTTFHEHYGSVSYPWWTQDACCSWYNKMATWTQCDYPRVTRSYLTYIMYSYLMLDIMDRPLQRIYDHECHKNLLTSSVGMKTSHGFRWARLITLLSRRYTYIPHFLKTLCFPVEIVLSGIPCKLAHIHNYLRVLTVGFCDTRGHKCAAVVGP